MIENAAVWQNEASDRFAEIILQFSVKDVTCTNFSNIRLGVKGPYRHIHVTHIIGTSASSLQVAQITWVSEWMHEHI